MLSYLSCATCGTSARSRHEVCGHLQGKHHLYHSVRLAKKIGGNLCFETFFCYCSCWFCKQDLCLCYFCKQCFSFLFLHVGFVNNVFYVCFHWFCNWSSLFLLVNLVLQSTLFVSVCFLNDDIFSVGFLNKILCFWLFC